MVCILSNVVLLYRMSFDPRTSFDATEVSHGAQPRPQRRRRPTCPCGRPHLPLLALCLAFFVEMVDNTLLTIALPTIGRDLGSGTTALQWVTGAYSLTFGGLLLTAGSAADRLGRRRVLLAGLAAFGV